MVVHTPCGSTPPPQDLPSHSTLHTFTTKKQHSGLFKVTLPSFPSPGAVLHATATRPLTTLPLRQHNRSNVAFQGPRPICASRLTRHLSSLFRDVIPHSVCVRSLKKVVASAGLVYDFEASTNTLPSFLRLSCLLRHD